MSVLFKPKQNFTIIQNKLLYANNISMKAKLMYIYLISKPERWNFSHERIAKEMMEGKEAVNRVLQELEDMKLLRRRILKTNEGKWGGTAYYVADIDDSSIEVSYYHATENKHSESKSLDERKENFRQLVGKFYREKGDKITPAQAKAFFEYWSEVNDNGTVMRFEKQKARGTFNTSQRMDTWIRNNNGNSYKLNYKRITNKSELPINNT